MIATARSRRAPRGLTLVEMLISLVIASIVIAGALTLMVSQQRAFRSSAADRAMQEAARSGLEELSLNLRRAGYGIEPWLAFDFGPVTKAQPSFTGAPVATTSYPSGPPGAAPPGCDAAVTPQSRDSLTGSDDIVFYARDPAFAYTLASAPDAGQLTLATPLKAATALEVGQVLQVMCAGASQWAYVTVGARAAPGVTTVTLSTTSCPNNAFPYQQSLLASGCFATDPTDVRVFKIERFHYYVDRFQGRPYLMLDRGLWSGTTPLVEPVAPDVEDIQFAYVFPNAVPSVRLGGAPPGTQLINDPASIDLAATPPAYTDPTISAFRTTLHPANIRAVQTSVIVRAAVPDTQLGNPLFQSIPAAGNRPEVAGDPDFRRLRVETTDATRNLDSRGPLYPAYSSNGGTDGMNVGGG